MSHVDARKDAELARLARAEACIRSIEKACRQQVPLQVGEAVDRLHPMWREIDRSSRDLAVRTLSSFVVDSIEDTCRYLLEVQDTLTTYVGWIGGPTALRTVANELDVLVGNPTVTLSTAIQEARLPAVRSWDDGPASTVYQQLPSDQARQLAAAKGCVDSLHDLTRQMADAIEQFQVALTAAVAGYAGAVAGLVAAVATIETAVGPIIGVVAAVESVVGTLVAAAELVLTTVQVQNNLLDQANRGFDGDWVKPPFAAIE